jgi:hypothetical protein
MTVRPPGAIKDWHARAEVRGRNGSNEKVFLLGLVALGGAHHPERHLSRFRGRTVCEEGIRRDPQEHDREGARTRCPSRKGQEVRRPRSRPEKQSFGAFRLHKNRGRLRAASPCSLGGRSVRLLPRSAYHPVEAGLSPVDGPMAGAATRLLFLDTESEFRFTGNCTPPA